MLKDRLVLLENEEKKLRETAGKLYFDVAVNGRTNLQNKYDESLAKLSTLITEIDLVKSMIADGQP